MNEMARLQQAVDAIGEDLAEVRTQLEAVYKMWVASHEPKETDSE